MCGTLLVVALLYAAATTSVSGSSYYTTMTKVSPSYKVYHNMWMHNGRWYALLPPSNVSDPSLDDGLGPNTAVVRTPVVDVEKFTANLKITHIPGNTLLVDFPFQAFYDNLAHWVEIMVPTFSMLYDEEWIDATEGGSEGVDNVLFPNLSRYYFNSFFNSILAVALAPGILAKSQPRLIDYAELDGMVKLGWLHIDNLVVVTDRYTHPQRKTGFPGNDHGDLWRYDGCDRWISPTFQAGFTHPVHGQEFRDASYMGEDLEPPAPRVEGEPPNIPRVITYVSHGAEGTAEVVNSEEVLAMLHEVAQQFGMEVQSANLTNSDPFRSHLVVAANTGILVGRHSTVLAGCVFLPPGAAVVELLPYKWEWHSMSKLFYNITQSIGDIHHFAWRPMSDKFCQYKDKIGPRYKDWFPSECHARECLQVYAAAGLIVDVEAVRQLLVSKIPGVLEGKSVEEMKEPWPVAV